MNKMFTKKLFGKKGFTLAELLIVIAIIAVLAAIAVPLFSAQLDKAKTAVENANERAVKSQASADYMFDVSDGTYDTDSTTPWTGTYYVSAEGDVYTTVPTNVTYTPYTATSVGTGDNVRIEVTAGTTVTYNPGP